MTDVAAAGAIIPGQLGFGWQAGLLGAIPILCILGCLIVFSVSPVGCRSRHALIRGIGRIPVLGRYLAFAGIVCSAVPLASLSLHLVASSSIQSLKVSGDIPPESWMRIRQDVGEGVTWVQRGSVTQVYFLKEKRAAVRRALEKEHIAAAE